MIFSNTMLMKKYILLSALLMITIRIDAQQSIGVNTITPHPNASLDINGVNKGILIPRGDVSSRTILNANTAKGLMMYDTLTNLMWVHNGNGLSSGWQSLSTGTNHWSLNGATGTEIANTNTGGFWSANASEVTVNPGPLSPPVSGAGTRMMWMPQKSAIRIGTVNNTNWDADSIGTWSTGIGYNVRAKGLFSLAMGVHTSASGLTSTSLGYNTKASGENSIAMGSVTTASGANTTSLGFKTYARSYGSVSLGRFNDRILTSDSTTWIASDPLLILGNGTSDAAPHNTLVIYKNGNLISKNQALINFDPGALPLPVTGPGTRMMWLPQKSAFRVGSIDNNYWNADSIGTWSTGIGYNTRAKGSFSFSTGYASYASGITSTAMGYDTKATGENSIATGSGSMATGYASTSTGSSTKASGIASMAMGSSTKAKGDNSSSIGAATTAVGTNSISLGFNTNARSYSSIALGRFNDSISIANSLSWINTDPLLIVGNGTSLNDLHNAMVIYKNGNMVLKNPVTVLSNPGTLPLPVSGSGTRMMWLPEKGAFRVGTSTGTQWNAENIGTWSFASGRNTNAFGINSTSMGYGTIASGDYATAIGTSCIASGNYSVALGRKSLAFGGFSTAMGDTTIASGEWSTAMGFQTKADGIGATAMGTYTVANGDGSCAFGNGALALGTNSVAMGGSTVANGFHSTAFGYFTRSSGAFATSTGLANIAKGYSSTVIGMYNDSMLTINQNIVDPISPLFIIGNGSAAQRTNAMVVRKDGHVGIGTNSPGTFLHIDAGSSLTDGIIVEGLQNNSAEVLDLGSGTRMTFFTGKAAFRAGGVTGIQWNDINSGSHSAAFGFNTIASGDLTTAFGESTIASGNGSIAMGHDTKATGARSIATGISSKASGSASISGGNSTMAKGDNSFSAGNAT